MPDNKMKVVDGVRYRVEDAPGKDTPERETESATSDVSHKARRPSRSARSGRDDSSE